MGVGSQFWRGLMKVKEKFYLGATFQVGNGEDTRFWIDTWNGEVPLKLEFPRLFACCRDKNITVSDCWGDEEWDIDFRRTFGAEEVAEWEQLLLKLGGVQLNDLPDKTIWRLEKKGIYTTKSMYRFLTFGVCLIREQQSFGRIRGQ
jgi:hypothetical protein